MTLHSSAITNNEVTWALTITHHDVVGFVTDPSFPLADHEFLLGPDSFFHKTTVEAIE